MEKLDRLEWAATIALSAYGLRIGIRVNLPRFPEELIERLPFGSKLMDFKKGQVDRIYSVSIAPSDPKAKVRKFHLVYSDALRIARTLEFNEAAEAFESDLERFVAAFSRREIFIHAGVVAWKNRAILIPGKSFSGKSTLVMALVQAGATYYSDEFAVVNKAGRVRPYPRKVSIRRDDARTRTGIHPGPENGTKALSVGAVILTRFRSGARWKPKRISPAKGLLKLVSNTVQARVRPNATLKRLQKLLSGASCLSGVRGEAQEIARSLIS